MARRGTTPRHYFRTNIDATMFDKLNIAYAQGGVIVVEKALEDCIITENVIAVKLSEADTLKFDSSMQVEIQLRAGIGDEMLASRIFTRAVDKILKDGAL